MPITLTFMSLVSMFAFPPPPQMATCRCRETESSMMLCEQPIETSCANYESYRMAAPTDPCEGYFSGDEKQHTGWLDCFETPIELGDQVGGGAEGGVYKVKGRSGVVAKVLGDQSDIEALNAAVFRLRVAYSAISGAAPRYDGVGITNDRRRAILMEALGSTKRLIGGDVNPNINEKTLDGIRAWYQRMYDLRAYDSDPQFVVEPDGTARPMDFGGLACVPGFAELADCPSDAAELVCKQYFNEWHSARRLAASGTKVKSEDFDKGWWLDLRPGEKTGGCDYESEEYAAP